MMKITFKSLTVKGEAEGKPFSITLNGVIEFEDVQTQSPKKTPKASVKKA